MEFISFRPEELEALWLSIQISFSSTLLITVPATVLAYTFVHCSFWGKTFLLLILHLPLVLPPVVMGYFLLVLLGREAWLGSWLYQSFGIYLPFNKQGAILACAVVSFPLFLRSAQAAFRLDQPLLKEAALSLGASPLRVFLTITLPRVLPGLFAGFILAWGRSLGEFGATITFVANLPGRTRTLALSIYTQLQNPTMEAQESALRLILLAVLLSFICLALSEYLQRKSESELRIL